MSGTILIPVMRFRRGGNKESIVKFFKICRGNANGSVGVAEIREREIERAVVAQKCFKNRREKSRVAKL